MRRVYLDDVRIEDGRALIRGSAAHHIRDVLREKAGDSFIGFDGSGHEYVIRITETGRDGVEGTVVSALKTVEVESPLKIILCQSLPKGPVMDDIVRDVTELGAAEIVPVISARVIPRSDMKAARYERWKKIARDAAKVAHRTIVPEIRPVMPFDEALAIPTDLSLLFWEGEKTPLKILASGLRERKPASVKVFVGPEGGYTAEEVALAKECSVVIAGLGRRILRTATAAPVAVALVLHDLEPS